MFDNSTVDHTLSLRLGGRSLAWLSRGGVASGSEWDFKSRANAERHILLNMAPVSNASLAALMDTVDPPIEP